MNRVAATLVATALVAVVATGCTIDAGSSDAELPATGSSDTTASATATTASTAVAPVPSISAMPAPPQCDPETDLAACSDDQRVTAVDEYLQSRPGTVGYVLRDRTSGVVHRNALAETRVWTASTIKLAMVVNLFERNDSGEITLTAEDRDEIQQMLHSSDDDAADALWFRYAGDDHQAFNSAFTRYGMTELIPRSGYTEFFPYWGFQECTPDDLDNLMQYVLTQLPASETEYIVGQLSAVDTDQQWGVWGAGPAAMPGNKDGWSLEDTGWVINTVGFAGPAQRFTLVIMNSLGRDGGYDDGVDTVSTVARLLLSDRDA